jgi:6-pyruvoyltetrahydropterin/6-carboxytetrahydropterin synthase
MIVAVRKTFQFHAAHRIPHHPGECRELHGHTYTVTIEARGPVQTSGPEEGMVIDFGVLKKLYREHIHSACDHAYLNDQFKFPTTAENLAQHFATMLAGIDERIIAVEVSEGPGNVARAEVAR